MKNEKITLLCQALINSEITVRIENSEDIDKIFESKALLILERINEILKTQEYDDFNCIENIVLIMEQNGFDCGFRHDY